MARFDSNGVPFMMPSFWLERMEYSKIFSEINQLYEVQYKGNLICAHTSFGIDGRAYVYWFENHGFGEYNIYSRTYEEH